MALSSATTYGTDCVMMLHMDGADMSTTFTDVSDIASTITAYGNAQIDTAESVFGGASGLFDGTGDYLTAPANNSFNASTGDYTIDFRVRFNTIPAFSAICGDYYSGPLSILYQSASGGSLSIRAGGTTNVSVSGVGLSTATWYHIAIVRTSGQVKFFVDGTQSGTDQANSTSADATPGTLFYVASNNAGDLFDGWIDEFRYVVGQAIWTSNFTPPSSTYVSTTLSPLRSSIPSVMKYYRPRVKASTGTFSSVERGVIAWSYYGITPLGGGSSFLPRLTLMGAG